MCAGYKLLLIIQRYIATTNSILYNLHNVGLYSGKEYVYTTPLATRQPLHQWYRLVYPSHLLSSTPHRYNKDLVKNHVSIHNRSPMTTQDKHTKTAPYSIKSTCTYTRLYTCTCTYTHKCTLFSRIIHADRHSTIR